MKLVEQRRIVRPEVMKRARKRVALLLALAEERDIILLDEWAAGPLHRNFIGVCR